MERGESETLKGIGVNRSFLLVPWPIVERFEDAEVSLA